MHSGVFPPVSSSLITKIQMIKQFVPSVSKLQSILDLSSCQVLSTKTTVDFALHETREVHASHNKEGKAKRLLKESNRRRA
jgi:hypothetical protein